MKHTLTRQAWRGLFFFFALILTGTYSTRGEAKDNTWGAIVAPGQRFQLLSNFNNQAVLDKETGLIWEQCPDLNTKVIWGSPSTTESAGGTCLNKVVGGRAGWRLPAYEELKSLGDPSQTPFLPNASPFCSMNFGDPRGLTVSFWSNTTSYLSADSALAANSISASGSIIGSKNTATFPVWCVRGGAGR
ncbi:MAG: DUF1566 domain-containing protein [bacterium]